MTDRQATLFEELKGWRVILAEVMATESGAIETELPGPHRDWHRGRHDALCAVLLQLDGMLDDHAEAERWHYPAEGEVPPEDRNVLADYGSAADWSAHWGRFRIRWVNSVGSWRCADGGDDTPTRWRYLSPADVPEAE